jgi:hypothetical protein
MEHRKRRCLASTVIVGAALIAPPALAQQPTAPAAAPSGAQAPAQSPEKNLAEAQSRYKAGMSLYDDGAYDAARVQFERAYELAPSYKILYNIGLVYKQLNEFVASLKALQRYIKEGGAEVPDDRKAEVNKLIDTLRGIIASASVRVNIDGAEVTVDDAVVAKSPTNEPILLNPGKRKIGAKMPGRIPDSKVITVASGDKATVDLVLQETSQTIVKTTDLKPIIAWTVTGALAVGSSVMWYLTAKAQGDLRDLQSQRNPDQGGTLANQLHDQHTKMKTYAVVTDILTLGTLVAGGCAVYFTWFAPKSAPTQEKGTETGGVSMSFGVTPGGGALAGTF